MYHSAQIQRPKLRLSKLKVHQECDINSISIAQASTTEPVLKIYPQKIFINNGRHLVGINVEDIAYCKANKDFTDIITSGNDSLLSGKGIGFIEEHLDPRFFVRVHRSYIINLKHAKLLNSEFSRFYFTINNVDIPVSRQCLPLIKQLIF